MRPVLGYAQLILLTRKPKKKTKLMEQPSFNNFDLEVPLGFERCFPFFLSHVEDFNDYAVDDSKPKLQVETSVMTKTKDLGSDKIDSSEDCTCNNCLGQKTSSSLTNNQTESVSPNKPPESVSSLCRIFRSVSVN